MRPLIAIVTLMLAGTPALAENIFMHSHSQVSNRLAILEDDKRVAYLYLTKPGTQQPERDAIAYMRISPVERVDWERVRKTGETPLLSKDLASPEAQITNPSAREFSFRWSRDGNAVALLRNGVPIAFASISDRYGYSKAVSKDSPMANAWNQAKYDATFR